MSERMGEQSLFVEALALASMEDRSAFLDQACRGDGVLRARVERLLAAYDQAGDFLEAPPPDVVSKAKDVENVTAPFEHAGGMIGAYKLLEQIGEGGMGAVFMAEQQRPVRRRVALKIIKPGLDTKQVIARFEAERQALAMMDHPNIAKVFEAATTDAGRPYFVMELVRGLPITRYCDDHQLTPRQRLELFVQVCSAVQHAHTKGIVHRDLKPTNVLVSVTDDGRPVPKVIDFGIAKATAGGQRLTEHTLFTEFRQLVGTPPYMSPEQAEASALMDVDTRSDVYSLGVLLYELLTGTTPFDQQRLAKVAYEEVRRIIREEEPPRPSTRISTLGKTLTAVSANRRTDPKRLGDLVRRELDWIVMRAMEKDRTRRYETPSALARDVEHYLAEEPVEACPPSNVYRLRKVMRRYRGALRVASAFVLLLVAATAVSLWQAVRATRAEHAAASQRDRVVIEKQRADEAAATAQAVNDFLGSILSSTGPRATSNDQISVVQAILNAMQRLDEGALDGKPLTEAATRATIGNALAQLGRMDEAERNLRTALEIQRRVLPSDHADLALTLHQLGGLFNAVGVHEQAEPLLREAVTIRRKRLPEREFDFALTLRSLGIALRALHKPGEAIVYDREAVAIHERLGGPEHVQTNGDRLALGYDLIELGRFEEAEQLLRRVVDVSRKRFGPNADNGVSELIKVLRRRGKDAEADELAVRLTRAPAASDTSQMLRTRASVLREQGSLSQAADLYRRSLEQRALEAALDDSDRAATLNSLAAVLNELGRPKEAAAAFATFGEPMLKHLTERQRSGETASMATALVYLGAALESAERYDEAARVYQNALGIRRRILGERSNYVPQVLIRLCGMLKGLGKTSEAEALWEECADRQRNAISPSLPDQRGAVYLKLAPHMVRSGQVDQAADFCRRAIKAGVGTAEDLNNAAWQFVLLRDLPQRHYELAVTMARRATSLAPQNGANLNTLGAALYRARQFEEATRVLPESIRLNAAQPVVSDCFILAMAYKKIGNDRAAAEWYAKAPPLNGARRSAEHRLFRDEAAEVLGLDPQPATHPAR